MDAHILVVDDDHDVLQFMKIRLEKWGFRVTLAKDGNEFRELVFKSQPNLIILDIMLGDENGAHIYDELVRRGLNKNIPVIFLSALANDRPESYAYPGRTYSLHGKPFEPEKLLAEIKSLVNC